MEYVKKRLALPPFANPDLIDPNHNPHELLNNLVNVTHLGTLSTTILPPSAFPPGYLLQTPPNRQWYEEYWSYFYSPRSPQPDVHDLNLVISFPWPVRISEVQVLFGGGMDACPSKLKIQTSEEDGSELTETPMNYCFIGAFCGTSSGSWIWSQLVEPVLVKQVLLRISKPDRSSFIHIAQIRILERPLPLKTFGFSPEKMMEMSVPHTLEYCYSALMELSTSEELLGRVIAVVLHSERKSDPSETPSKPLMETLVGPVVHRMWLGRRCLSTDFYYRRLNSIVGLIYDLCTLSNERGRMNLAAAIQWLQALIVRSRSVLGVSEVELMFLRALSAALWSVAAAGNGENIKAILTPKLLQVLLAWSMDMNEREVFAELKAVSDYLICSICYCRPALYIRLMHSMNLLKVNEGIDLKGGSLPINQLEKWYNEGDLWTKLKLNEPWNSKVNSLETLGRASQSATSAGILMESNLLESFKSAILEFCKSNRNDAMEKAGDGNMSNDVIHFAEMFTLFHTLSHATDFRNWICENLRSNFWLPVLNYSSVRASLLKWSYVRHGMLKMGRAMFQVLKTIYWANQELQEMVLECVKEVLSKETSISVFSRDLIYHFLVGNKGCSVRVRSERRFTNKSCGFSGTRTEMNLGFHPSMDVKGQGSVHFVDACDNAEDILDYLDLDEEIVGSSNVTLRLMTCPNVPIPNSLPVHSLFAAQSKSSAGMPFLNILEFSLSEKTPKLLKSSSPDEDGIFDNVTPVKPFFKAFAENGGLLLLFERLAPQINAGGVARDIIKSFVRFLNIPEYSGIFLDLIYSRRIKDLLVLLIRGDDGDDEDIEPFQILPFEALDWLLRMQPSFQENGRCLRRNMVEEKAFHYVLEYLEGLTDIKSSTDSVDVEAKDFEGEEDDEEKEMKGDRVICLLNIIIHLIRVEQWDWSAEHTEFLEEVHDILKKSCLVSMLSGFLRNESDLNIADHMPLYRVIFQLLSSFASIPQLSSLLISSEGDLAVFQSARESHKDPDRVNLEKMTRERKLKKSWNVRRRHPIARRVVTFRTVKQDLRREQEKVTNITKELEEMKALVQEAKAEEQKAKQENQNLQKMWNELEVEACKELANMTGHLEKLTENVRSMRIPITKKLDD